ncbi:MAG: hypothetical protein Q7V19_17895 [Bacteroidales bacterium]|nr:hypothetical protein [Bacteroidales bacterium]MDP2236664.1 hypothetical protein [Bacteroidales bacterium]
MQKPPLYQAILLVFIIFSFTGCVLDDDIDPNTDDPQAIYIGTWSVSDNETKINYQVSISRNPSNSTEVLLQNFAGSGSTATALVTGKTLTLTSPVIGNNWAISGSGVYKNSSRIDFTYSLTIGGNRENRFALFTR